MGWSSGGDVFDPVAETLREMDGIPEQDRTLICVALIKALQGNDWDTEDESLEHFRHTKFVTDAFAEAGVHPPGSTMDETLRWEIADRLDQAEQDGMVIWENDAEVPSFPRHTWTYWRDALGHPHADGHGHCHTCGPAITCSLDAFRTAYRASVLRELDCMGNLRPPPTCCPKPDMWFDRSICPEPCGSMHDRCNNCLTTMGGCVLESDRQV